MAAPNAPRPSIKATASTASPWTLLNTFTSSIAFSFS